MIDEEYKSRRSKLLSEYFFLKSKRLYRCAADRIRKIAKLDFDYDGTPIEETKRKFNHDNIINRG